ncbi:MAG TPA: AI-2E family transporter [Blastocatellia bacterium]|nr:AI-2E family transporter [Blastocatellia bacterium]
MTAEEKQSVTHSQDDPELRRRSPATTIFLVAVGVLLAYLCFQIVQPFLTAFAWATILAVVFGPLHDRISRLIRRDNLSAFISTSVTILVVILPLVLMGLALAREAREGYHQLALGISSGRDLAEVLSESRVIGPVWHWVQNHLQQWNVDINTVTKDALGRASGLAVRVATQTLANLTTFFINVVLIAFTLFYFFRDGRVILRKMQRTAPMRAETVERIYHQIAAIIRAAINGVVGINLIKGFLAGLAFWMLGLQSPVLWGVVGAIVSVIPVVGISLVWGPAAIALWLQGHTIKAILLAIWGLTVLSLLDNFLYPILVGNQIRLHTLMIFFSTLGGLAVFGLLGFVLGPVIAALSLTLIRVASDYYSVSGRAGEQATGAGAQK